MGIAEFRDIEKGYAGRSVLRGISFELQPGQKIGLVGPNGAGKTTLLKILAGVETADSGTSAIAKNVTWSYVSQVPRLDPEETLHHQVALVFEEVHAIERQMHEAAELLGKHASGPEHDAAMEKYARLEAHFNHMRGYDIQHRVEAVLDELGFAERDLDLPIKALSGGQKSRAQIARLLLEAPDLMLLDEPTNHLDLKMLDWLEETLNAMTDATLVVVSHDRYFLDSVVDEIWELQGGTIAKYPGNYSAYVTLKAERELTQQRAFDQQQSYIAKQEEYIRRFQAGQRAKQARGRRTRLERLKDESLVGKVRRDGRKVILNLQISKASGHEVLKTEGLSKAYGEKKLFEGVDMTVIRGKRLGVIGPNGSGKTTLLNTLFGEVTPDAGAIKWGHGVALRYYRQEHQDLDESHTIIDELQKVRITANQQELRDLAALFLFSGDTIEKPIRVLSGGEKSRVALAKLLLQPTNTILMDEPTNHLDMNTAEVLEEALDSYDGTLVLVSHDRYFMDQVCDMLLVLDGKGGWRLLEGSYTDYLARVTREREAAQAAKKEAEKAQRRAEAQRQEEARKREKAEAEKKAAGKKVPFKYQKMSVEEVEAKIYDVELEVAELEAGFGDARVAANAAALAALQGKYDAKKAELAELTAVWEMKAT